MGVVSHLSGMAKGGQEDRLRFCSVSTQQRMYPRPYGVECLALLYSILFPVNCQAAYHKLSIPDLQGILRYSPSTAILHTQYLF